MIRIQIRGGLKSVETTLINPTVNIVTIERFDLD